MIRAFLAVESCDEVRSALSRLQDDLKQQLASHLSKEIRLTWGQLNSFHLTLRFLGNMDEQWIDPMREALMRVRQSHPTITIPLNRLHAFPSLERPRVLWVGPSEEWLQSSAAKQLRAFHREVEAWCRSFDLEPDDKPFMTHLTVARIKGGDRQVGQLLAQSRVCDQSFALGTITVGPVVLMKSRLRPTGPVYTKLWEVGEGKQS